jgi:murein L,D-transpeptidase YafK
MPRGHLKTMFAACAVVLCMGPASGSAQLARELGLLPPASDVPLAPRPVAALPTETSFALEQLRHERVREARLQSRFAIKRLFHEQGIAYPAAEIFLRIFKRERTLELWVRSADADRFALLKTYDICAMAGSLGPKRRQGDSQTPEGFYHISWFNPQSEYHLSLHIDYPNRRDRASGLEGVSLGGDIFIHGGCSSEGCLAITDAGIRELYWLSVEARAGGQMRIPVHIFPARLETQDFEILQRTFGHRPDLGRFWATLKPGYDYFEQHRRLPAVGVDARGEYAVNGASLDGPAPLGVPAGERAAPAAAAPATRQPLGSPAGG